MKSLFNSITDLSVDDDFSMHFQIMNIYSGWKIIDNLECADRIKNQLVKYVAYAYSVDSPLLRKKKERLENKTAILFYIDLAVDDFILDCINNRNTVLNKYITWWLRETADRDFSALISAEDLYFDLLETARSGVEKVVVAKDEKQAEKAMKSFTKMEVILKADAYDRAMKVKDTIESQSRNLEKNYQYLHNTVKSEGVDLPDGIGWAERSVLKRRK